MQLNYFSYLKAIVFILLLLPFTFLLWDIFNDNLIDPIEEITNPTGQWALRILLLTLFVTPISKITGYSFIRLRRMLGLFVFFYAFLHIAIFLISQNFETALIVEEIIKRPYITLGFIAFILLFLLAITSNNRSIKALKKNWKKLHKSVYLIAILVIVHFYWQAKSYADIEPLIYTVITALLLLYRVKKIRLLIGFKH